MPTKISTVKTLILLPILALPGCAQLTEPTALSGSAQEFSSRTRPETLYQSPDLRPKRAPLEWAASRTYQANGPVRIELSSIPANVFDPKNKLARGWGQGGEAKRMTKRIPPEEAQRLRDEAMKLPPDPGIQQVDKSGPLNLSTLTAGTSFDSLDYTECCGGGGNVPPDPELAVGPNHIIAVVNVAFEIYNKSGVLLAGPITFSSFFGSTPGCTSSAVFDPNVLYDEEADRFILGIDGDGTDYCVAATTGPDPLGSWNSYGFATDYAGAFFDYPHAGVGVDAIYMGSNQFGGTLTGGFEGRVFAMDKLAMYTGSPMTVVTKSTGSDGGTPQPMNIHGMSNNSWPTSGPHYIMTEVFDGANHTVWSWSNPFGINNLTNKGNLNLNTATGVTAGFPIDVPQNGGEDLQGNDWRGLDTEYRNGNIWMTNTIACNPGSGTVNCIRWAKIDPAVPEVLDAGVLASNGEYRTFPDLAVNHCEDVAIGYSKSSASIYPGIWMTGRENGDTAGTLKAESQVKAGEIAYTSFETTPPRRWGDYTGMTIDPDGKTFWYLGEYSKDTGTTSGRWGTYIASYTFPACDAPPPYTPPRNSLLLQTIPSVLAAEKQRQATMNK